MQRTNIASGGPWATKVAYSRAVRIGPIIAVAGTTAVDARGNLVGTGDPHLQAQRCIEIIEAALEEAGASLADVIRTRIYVTDIEQWLHIARAHAAAFGDNPPATSMVEVSRLIHPDMLVEIEADAVVPDSWAGHARLR